MVANDSQTVTVQLELCDEQALALAQFVKRLGFSEIRVNAVDEQEAYQMRDAIDALRYQLAHAGYAPR